MAAFDVERSNFAICRLSEEIELSNGERGYRTLGSGSVVRSEDLRKKLKSNCAVFLITTDEVITENLLDVQQRHPNYKIIAEFRKVESTSTEFEKHELNKKLFGSSNVWTVRGIIFIALTKLDKRFSFRKSSLITSRPLDIMLTPASFDDEMENSFICLVLFDAIGDHAKGFGTRLYKLKSQGRGEGYFLKREETGSKTTNRYAISRFGEDEFPLGSAILSTEGLFVGVLKFDNPKLRQQVSPVSLFSTAFEIEEDVETSESTMTTGYPSETKDNSKSSSSPESGSHTYEEGATEETTPLDQLSTPCSTPPTKVGAVGDTQSSTLESATYVTAQFQSNKDGQQAECSTETPIPLASDPASRIDHHIVLEQNAGQSAAVLPLLGGNNAQNVSTVTSNANLHVQQQHTTLPPDGSLRNQHPSQDQPGQNPNSNALMQLPNGAAGSDNSGLQMVNEHQGSGRRVTAVSYGYSVAGLEEQTMPGFEENNLDNQQANDSVTGERLSQDVTGNGPLDRQIPPDNGANTQNNQARGSPEDDLESQQQEAYRQHLTGYVVENLTFGCLDSMAKLLDRCYGTICYWPHLAEKLDVSDRMRTKIKHYSKNIHSPTEDLFNNLSATQPNLSVEEMVVALENIERFDVKEILEEQYAVIRNTEENISFKDLATKPIKIWSEMAVRLDSAEGALSGYKDLAETLGVPRKAFQQFGSDSRSNPTKELFCMLKTGKPWTKVRDLKAIFNDMKQKDVYNILCYHFQDDTEVENVYNNINVMESIAKVLNKSTGSDYPWKTLAGKLGYKDEDVFFLEPQEDAESPTMLVFDHLKQLRPKLFPLEKVIISLADIDRYDVLKKMKEREYVDFHGGYVDTVLRRAGKLTTEGYRLQFS